ncbi:hypothetical protein [Pseudomonas sp. NCCP-436]|uniref:hypothetical protein n=1 Tax=Pseudomonas sp. NCCP-436 TaxID=2842481 RepID=UPI001C824657|nr:hypothetical protein [Pseudomonas sp. NCCP-436]GIZ11294.1 hypothetical protein NCCP436_07100 [Pseudomonas sp. NCCP-436]
MPSNPLLTQDELDYIQQILADPPSRPQAEAQPKLGEQLSELLGRLDEAGQLTLNTRQHEQHLSFPLHLVREGSDAPRLELGAPQIFEGSNSERPWRMSPSSPLQLLDEQGNTSDLQVVELSHDGMLVHNTGSATPAANPTLRLLLPRQRLVCLQLWLVRRVSRKRYAYRLVARQAKDEQLLLQYLFEQHQALQHNGAAAGQPHRAAG